MTDAPQEANAEALRAEHSAGNAPTPAVLEAARALVAEASRADGSPPVSDQAMLAASRGQRELVLFSQDTTDAAPLAVGIIGDEEIDLVVHPDARGRGIGTRALALLTEGVDTDFRAWSHGDNPAADTLLARSGFHPVRTLLRMHLALDRLPEAISETAGDQTWPAGLHAVSYDPSSAAQREEWVNVNAAAFADHPEQGSVTTDDVQALEREPWFDPEDLILLYGQLDDSADAPDRLLGYAWVKTVREADSVESELYVLGVSPDAAGRGLGRRLLGAALHRMSEHQPTKITLYVDGENTRAVELYERSGFEVEARSRQWLRPRTDA